MKTKAEPRPKYQAYPQNTVSERCGCKVSWRTYASRADAEKCAEAARWNGQIDAGLGYDFGYCCPGSIDVRKDGTFEVCIP